jgi:hypothetical protein
MNPDTDINQVSDIPELDQVFDIPELFQNNKQSLEPIDEMPTLYDS